MQLCIVNTLTFTYILYVAVFLFLLSFISLEELCSYRQDYGTIGYI
jgi:hypothetical protein